MKLHNENLIKKWEKLRLEAYMPTPDDVWTIGWGHTHGVSPGDVITEAQAEKFFDEDVQWAEDAVNRYIKVGMSQHQFDALVSLCFNIGATAFKTSTVVKRMNAGNVEGAAEALTWWNKQKGKTLRGLVRRRSQEKEYFLTADKKATEQVERSEDKSLTPDSGDGFKSLLSSKEVIAGLTASLTGVGSFLGGLDQNSQLLLCGALTAAGGFFLWNRFRARNKGER